MKKNNGSPVAFYTMCIAGLFLAGFFLLVVFGAQIYRGTVEGQTQNNRTRALLSYLSACVRANDAKGAVTVGDFDGEPVLIIADGESGYGLRIYRYEDCLVEDYGRIGESLNPAQAQTIGETKRFEVREVAEDTYFVVTDAGSVLLNVRSGEAVAHER